MPGAASVDRKGITMNYRINRELVRQKIEDKKLMPTEAAERIGISYSAFWEIMLTGMCSPINIGKIAKFLDVQVWELLI